MAGLAAIGAAAWELRRARFEALLNTEKHHES